MEMFRRLVPRLASFSTYTVKRDPLSDSAFEAVFKDEIAVKSLLSAVYGTEIVQLDYLSPYLKDSPPQRGVRFDLRVKDADGGVSIVGFCKTMVDRQASHWIQHAVHQYCNQNNLRPAKITKGEMKPKLKPAEFSMNLLPVRVLVVYDSVSPRVTDALDKFLPNNCVISDYNIVCVQSGSVAPDMSWKFVRLDLFVQLIRKNSVNAPNHQLSYACIEWLNLLTSHENADVNEQTVQDAGVRRGYEILSTAIDKLPLAERQAHWRAQEAKREMYITAQQIARSRYSCLFAADRFAQERKLRGRGTTEEELMGAYGLERWEAALVLRSH
jgi:hypothetical protein